MKVNITQKWLKELKVGARQVFGDSSLPCFQVRVGTNRISFYVQRRVGRKLHEIRIGHWPDMHLDEARKIAQKTLGALENYKTPDAASPRRFPTIGEAVDHYLTNVKNPSAVKSCISHFNHLRARRMAELERHEVAAVHAKLKKTPYLANRAVKYLSAAITCMSKSIGVELQNPAKMIPMYKERPRQRILDAQEAATLLRELITMSKVRMYATQATALLMMIYTGQRKSNVLSMRFDEIKDGIWVIPGDKAKAARDIVVPLNSYALEIVKARQEVGGEWLFPSVRAGATPHLLDVKKTFATACLRCGIAECHIHDLRRTLGSWMLMSGSSIDVVSKTLGHSSIRVTEQVYAHLLPGKIADATTAAIDAMVKK